MSTDLTKMMEDWNYGLIDLEQLLLAMAEQIDVNTKRVEANIEKRTFGFAEFKSYPGPNLLKEKESGGE